MGAGITVMAGEMRQVGGSKIGKRQMGQNLSLLDMRIKCLVCANG